MIDISFHVKIGFYLNCSFGIVTIQFQFFWVEASATLIIIEPCAQFATLKLQVIRIQQRINR